MEKNELEDYINKLKQFETILSSDSDVELPLIGDIEGLLKKLNSDIQQSFIDENSKLKVKIKLLSPGAKIPTYSKDGDAGMDLTITNIIFESETQVTYGFGLSMEIPKGYVGLIFPRSSVRDFNLLLSNSVGVIDSGYRGEICATFKKTNTDANIYGLYDRGAQIIILPYPQIEFIESDNLTETERGDGGFGHTGI